MITVEIDAMQRVNRMMSKEEMLKIPFEHRAELFKRSVENAAKKFLVELDCGYIQSYHDSHVVIADKVDEHNQVYYATLTQEE